MPKVNRSVVRVAAYSSGSVGIRERHNERKNEAYANESVEIDRSYLNVHYKKCETTYEQGLEKLLADGVVSTRGLKPDAKLFDEFVFDINTEYFDAHGGYDYAKKFYEDAYHFAEKEVGGSQYIISAVMHADEKNEGLSLLTGKDVYHYHLHVIALPVVEKQVKYTTKCKDKALVGTVKEVIHQISHSKKWKSMQAVDENGNLKYTKKGKPLLIPSYSPLQDRYFEHMQDAGYPDFERGIRGSTAEHLSVLDYKIKQDKLTVEMLNDIIEEKRIQGDWLQQTIDELSPIKADFDEIDAIGKKTVLGKVQMLPEECEKLKTLAKEAVKSRGVILELKEMLGRACDYVNQLKNKINDLTQEIAPYREALRIGYDKVKDFFKELFQKDKTEKEKVQEEREYNIAIISKKRKREDCER